MQVSGVRYVRPTLVEALDELSADTKRGYTFVRPDGSEAFFSFQALGREAQKRGAFLREQGLKKGDRVALVIPDSDEFVLTFFGAIRAGIVPVPIYPQLSFKNVEGYHDTVSHVVNASGAKLLVTTATTKPFVDPILPRTPGLQGIVTTEVFAGLGEAQLTVEVSPSDLAFLQFTSGSTSRPKGVMVSHGNLAANSEAFMIHGVKRDSAVDKGVSWLPLFHDMGLIGFVIGPLFSNIEVVFLPTASFVRAPRLWLDTMHKHRATITYAPNFAYALVAKRVKERDVAGLDLSSLRVAGCGAEPIQARTLRDFAAKLAPAGFDPRAFLPSYGMAEATLAITFVEKGAGLSTDLVDAKALQAKKATPTVGEGEGVREIVNCGRAFPDHEVAIVDENGHALPDRTVGEIVTRGPSICAGYFEEPELTAAAFRPVGPDGRAGGPWLHTGDLGYTVDGSVFICGRVKDIIIIRGRNYYPQDIEWSVGELPGVRRGNVVAFGVDVDGDEQLVVCAEAHASDAAGLADSVAQLVTSEFALAVHRVEVVPQGSLPRTSSGKPQRRKTKQLFLEGLLPTARRVLEGSAPEVTGTAGASEGVGGNPPV
jgi:fatty-acyl-CoA synthase